MITVPGRGGILREVWHLARMVIIAVLIMSFLSSLVVTPMKTGSKLNHYILHDSDQLYVVCKLLCVFVCELYGCWLCQE